LKALTESAATIVQAVDLRFDLRNSLHPLGELTRVNVYLHEAERLAERLGDERRVGRASLYLAHNLDAQGDHEAAVAAGQRALTIGRRLGDLGLQVVANNYLGYFFHALGDYPAAIQVLEEAVAALAGDMKYERFGTLGLPAAVSHTWLAWSCAELGEFGTAADHGEEAVHLAGAAKHPYSLIIACWGLGYTYLRRGEVARAVAILERALDLCRDSELRIVFPHSAACAGFAHAHSGRIDSAISLLDKAVEAGASMKFMIGYTLDVAWLGEAYLIAGRIGQASELGARALELSRRYKERGYEAWVRWLLGEVARARHLVDHTIAESHYRLAMALGVQLGMRPFVAHCHLGLGKLYRRTGEREQAQEHLTTATTMYREMGMTYWLEQAEAQVN
jgi:tetratricopeptide (TPR) repeat protein